jgi:hypothetical protein
MQFEIPATRMNLIVGQRGVELMSSGFRIVSLVEWWLVGSDNVVGTKG